MTNTQLDIELDEATEQEIRPPCRFAWRWWPSKRISERCQRQAEWITSWHCENCQRSATGFFCTEHHVIFNRDPHSGLCKGCMAIGHLVLDSTEPL